MEAMNLQLFCFLTLVSLHITRALHFHKEDYFQSRFAPIEDVYPYFLHEHDMDWLMASSQAVKRDAISDINSKCKPDVSIADFCNLKCVKTGSNIEFQVKKGSDCIVPSVKKVFTVLTPGLSLDDASSKFINTDLYYLSSLKIEGSKAATVVGQAKSKIRLMGGYFDLVQVEGGQPPGLEVSWDITKSGLKLEDLEIKLSGTTKVASMPGTMEVEKPKGKAKFRLKLSYGGGQNLKLVDWMGHFQLYLPGMVDDAKDGIDIGKFSGLRFNNPNITGVFDVDDAFQIYCKDKVAHTQTFGFAGTEFYFIVNRPKDGPVSGAMACVFPPKKNIKELMDPLMKNQATIRAYAMLRRFIGQCVLLIAPKEIVMIEDEDLLTYLKPVLTPSDTKMIPKGVTIKVKVPMKDNMKECAPDVQFGAEVPDIFPLNIAVANTGLRFTYPDKFKTDLPSLLKCADPMIAATLPNQIFPKTNMPFDVQECTLSRDFKRFQIVLKGPYKIVGDAIKLGDIKLAVQKVGDKPMTFIGLTTVNIGSFTCQVTLTKQDKAYTFKGIIESFNLGMLRFLVGDNDIGKIASMFDALKNIAIKDFTWIVNFGSSNMLRFSGQPILFGYDKLFAEAVVWYPKDSRQPSKAIAIGFWFKMIKLDWLFEKLFDRNVIKIAWLSRMNAIICISNAHGTVKGMKEKKEESKKEEAKHEDKPGGRHFVPSYSRLWKREGEGSKDDAGVEKKPEEKKEEKKKPADPDISFNIPGLAGVQIKPGITFIGTFRLPPIPECFKNPMCEWMTEKLGRDATLRIGGRIAKTEFEIFAQFIGTVTLVKDKLSLREIMFKILLKGIDSNIRLSCTLYYTDAKVLGRDTTLQFTGAIEVGFSGKLKLEFAMAGIWKKPFGFGYLAFGNVLFGIGISRGLPFPSIDLGCEIWLGKLKDTGENSHAVKIKGYFGIDPNNPQDNYVFAQFNKLTLNAFFQAFEIKAKLPKFLGDTGFPEGLTLSYSLRGKYIQPLGINVGVGLFVQGKINIFGMEVWGKIILQPDKNVYEIDIQMTPLDLVNGLIAVRRNEQDKKNGPKCWIRIRPDFLRVDIEGYAEVLGINNYVMIQVSDTGFKFNTSGTMMPGIFDAGLYLSATYGNLKTISFEVRHYCYFFTLLS